MDFFFYSPKKAEDLEAIVSDFDSHLEGFLKKYPNVEVFLPIEVINRLPSADLLEAFGVEGDLLKRFKTCRSALVFPEIQKDFFDYPGQVSAVMWLLPLIGDGLVDWGEIDPEDGTVQSSEDALVTMKSLPHDTNFLMEKGADEPETLEDRFMHLMEAAESNLVLYSQLRKRLEKLTPLTQKYLSLIIRERKSQEQAIILMRLDKAKQKKIQDELKSIIDELYAE